MRPTPPTTIKRKFNPWNNLRRRLLKKKRLWCNRRSFRNLPKRSPLQSSSLPNLLNLRRNRCSRDLKKSRLRRNKIS